jgi:MFS family permease
VSRKEITEPTPRQPGWGDLLRGRLAIYAVVLNLGSGLFAIDTFVIMTIMPTVLADIGGAEFYSWTLMLYVTGAICGSASGGPVRAIFGRRWGYVLSSAFFLIGVLGASSANDILTLTAWRLIQGIGGGLVMNQSMALVSDLYPPELRTRMFSLLGSVWAVALFIGPAIGGISAQFGSWRGALWTMAPLGLISATLGWHFIPPSKPQGSISGFPFARLLMLAGGVMCVGLMSQFTENGMRAFLGLGAVGLMAGAVYLDARGKTKMFPSRPFTPWTIAGAAYWLLLLMGISTTFINVYTTLYVQVLHGLEAIVAGYFYALFSFSWTFSAFFIAGLRGRAMWTAIWFGLVCFLLGVIGLALFAVPGPLVLIGVSLLLLGIGVGFPSVHIIERTMAAGPKEEEALTAGSVQTIRTLGVAFGAALAGMIANDAGLGAGAGQENVASAIQAVYGFNVVLGVLVVLAGIPFTLLYRTHLKRLEAEAGAPPRGA